MTIQDPSRRSAAGRIGQLLTTGVALSVTPRAGAASSGSASVPLSIVDAGAVENRDIGMAVAAALLRIGRDRPAALVFPAGRWQLNSDADWSAFENVTMIFEHGAVIRHGAHRVVLPPGVETGTAVNRCFEGTGAVVCRTPGAPVLKPIPDGWLQYGNVAMGVNALRANTGGTNNFAIGINALADNETGSANIALGNDALRRVKGGTIPATGTFTGHGWNNIAIGDAAQRDCESGYENLAIGTLNLRSNRTGKWNVAIGHNSQILNTTGDCNISFGAYCLTTNFGNNNLAIGWAALEGQVTGSNIAIGHTAMNANHTGTLNTAIGSEALFRNVSGNQNVALGIGVLANLTSGSNNTAIGSYALSSLKVGASRNTALGQDALLHATTGNGNTALGHGALAGLDGFDDCTGVGIGAAVTGSRQLQLGNDATTVHSFGAVHTRSDARDKADVRDTRLGLNFIRALRPVDFRWNPRREPSAIDTGEGSRKRVRFHHGLIAQEVEAAARRVGIAFGGVQDHALDGGSPVMSIGYEELIAPLIKAVQELSAEVDMLRRMALERQA